MSFEVQGPLMAIVVPREAISCPLCEELFETAEPGTPCVLPCFHTYCRKCLKDWVKKDEGAAAGFSCPTCRTVCTVAVEALQVNFALMTVVEAERVSTGQTKLKCQECDEDDEPTHRCQECNLLMCEACTTHHRRTKIGKHHTMQPIEEFKQCKQAIPREKRTCKKHKDQGLDLYCLTCHTPICFHGTVKDHLGHEYDLLPDVAGKHQVCLQRTLVHTQTNKNSTHNYYACTHAHTHLAKTTTVTLRSVGLRLSCTRTPLRKRAR